jgi:para-nitrobenzyl esterase
VPVTKIQIDTPSGRVEGILDDGVRIFRSIPYAQPPVGDLRFVPPVPVEPWPGVRDCTVAGATAPQQVRDFPGLDIAPLIGRGWVRGDDYLALNVWAPADGEKRPVMVFVHGGGFMLGSKDVPVNDGAAFARSGVVMVAINYRMGVDGFLPVPGGATNLGLRDIITALAWVRDTIDAFGGDPDNVTLFGESAGAMATANLLVSPLAKGLFQRAIVQSGHGSMVREIPIAQRLVRKVAKLMGITPDLAGFRTTTPEQCIQAVEAVSAPKGKIDLRDAEGRDPVFGISRFIPVFGDDVLPDHPLTALAGGAGREVDLLIGSNAEEMNLYWVPTGVKRKLFGLLARFILSRSLPHAGRALKAYGMGTRGVSAGQAFADATNDLVFRWPARRYAALHQGRTHMYEFDWRSPAFGGELGACHGMELPFVFDTLATTTGPQGLAGENPPQALATRVHGLWVGFATDGSLPWPIFDDESRQVYQLEAGKPVHEPVMKAAAFLP